MKLTSKKVTEKKDNSSPARKIYLRNRFMPEDPVVLDLFCGNGVIYNACYTNAKKYHGVDREKVHDPTRCDICDNLKWVRQNDLSEYTLIDLDDYGVPWLLFFIVLKKLKQERITVFVTDGSPLHMKLTGNVTKLISATEGTPKKFKITGLSRYYLDIVKTMLKQTTPRFGYEISEAHVIPNKEKTVIYWHLTINKIK